MFGLHTGVQVLSTSALQLCSCKKTCPTAQCCCVEQAGSSHVSLQHTYECLVFIQVYRYSAPVHCSSVHARRLAPLLSVAVWNRLAAAMCHYSTPMNVWSSYRCTGTQHQCTAALIMPKFMPKHFSTAQCCCVKQV